MHSRSGTAPATASWTRARLNSTSLTIPPPPPRLVCPSAPSLEEAGEPAVGERLAARLAGGTVLQRLGGERDLTDDVAAGGAGLAGTAVHPHGALLVAFELGRAQPDGPLHRLAEHALQGPEQPGELLVVEGAGGLVGRQ